MPADGSVLERLSVQVVLFLSPLLLLLIAHGIIIILYDANPWILRIASMLIPLPFGAVSWARGNRHLLFSLVFALGLAISAVLGMSAITGMVDGAPVLPQDLREWREILEFAASISFSFLTGLLVARWSRSAVRGR